MDCNEIRVLLINTLYETLDRETAREVEEHLADCQACRRQVEESRALLKAYREAPKPKAPAVGITEALEAGRITRAEIVSNCYQHRPGRYDPGGYPDSGIAGGLDRWSRAGCF